MGESCWTAIPSRPLTHARSLDTSLYTGDVNYVSISSNAQDYWRIPTEATTVNGNVISGVVSVPRCQIGTALNFRPTGRALSTPERR